VFDGTPFSLNARTKPFAVDRASELNFHMGTLNLAAWQPYVPVAVPVVLTRGTLAADLALRFSTPPEAPLEVGLNGRVTLAGVALTDRQGRALGRFGDAGGGPGRRPTVEPCGDAQNRDA